MPTLIAYTDALALALESVDPLASEDRPLADSLQAVASEDIRARVDAPSAAVSLRDGYAVRSTDLMRASAGTPVRLALAGVAAAGDLERTRLPARSAVRILTGGRIPLDADAVVAEECTRKQADTVVIESPVAAGRHVLPKGADLAADETLVAAGERLTPGRLGLLAAAGRSTVRVHRRLRVGILATGDEIRLPGTPLAAGQLYASNAVTLDGWCRRCDWETAVTVVPDRTDAILAAIRELAGRCDVILTSGGAWSGDRDLVRPALETLEWRKVFHGIRLSPGKGTGMGIVDQCPVFLLSGGPPANLMGFLKLVLPALLKMGGQQQAGLPRQGALLQEGVSGRQGWTRAIWGRVRTGRDGRSVFEAHRRSGRLKTMGRAQAVLTIPESVEHLAAGTPVTVERLE